jgi:hypothetical protein
MEGPKQFEDPVSVESTELLKPLAHAEAEMIMKEVGEKTETRGVLTRIQKYARATLLATALSGAFAIGFRPADSEAEAGEDPGSKPDYTITRKDVYDKAYEEEMAKLQKGYGQKDEQTTKEVARNRARADFLRQQNPMDIIGAAREKEMARLDAQRIEKRKSQFEQMGRDAAHQQAILRNHPIDRFIINMFNKPNETVSPIINNAFDGQ